MAQKKRKPRFPRATGALRRFFGLPYVYDFAIAVLGLSGGVANSWRAFDAGEKGPGVLWALTAIGVCLFSVVKIAVQWSAHQQVQSTSDLEGCLHTLNATLMGDRSNGHDPKLRATLHQPVDGDMLEQVLDYVGDERGGSTVGRRFPAQSGIIGAAFRSKEPRVARRDNPDLERYREELIDLWAFTEDGARKVSPDTMSWMAVPIKDGNSVIAIVYVDSVLADFFDAKRQLIVIWASTGIAAFAARRYK